MAEQFKFDEHRDQFAGWAFIAALCESLDKDNFLLGLKYGEPVTVEFRANGFDLPFSRVMKRLDEEFDRLVLKKAEELVRERLDEFSLKFDEVLGSLKRGAAKVFPDVLKDDSF